MFEKEIEKFMENVFPYEDEEPMYGEEQVKGLLAIFAESIYNKANEWHDLQKDNNDLPTENMKQVIVMTNYNECLMGWYCIHEKTWYSSSCPDPDDYIETEDILKVKVVKWKEIR